MTPFRVSKFAWPPLQRGRRGFRIWPMATVIVGLVLSSLAVSLPAGAQGPTRIPRIGVLGNTDSTPEFSRLWGAFRQGLAERGWIEGQNVAIEYRWAEGKFDQLPELAADLVRLKVDLIVVPSSIYVDAAKRATSTIPIVFAVDYDPVGTGHAAALARPGGNMTGLSLMQTELGAKQLQLLKEIVPRVTRIAVLWNPATSAHGLELKAVEAAAQTLAVQLQALPVGSPKEFETAFAAMTQEHSGALVVFNASVFFAEKKRLADLAVKHRLPAMFTAREYAAAGGLLSYAPDFADLFRRSATYVDKILKGAKPADLPVEQATKFEVVVNLKTAKALGITIPQSILVRADEVIR